MSSPTKQPLSYHAQRMSMLVDASVDGSVLNWRYKAGGDEWKQSIPLAELIPHPMISIDRRARRRYIAITCFGPVAAAVVMWWLDFAIASTIGLSIVALLIFAYRFGPWLRGPIEWAVFDTTLKDKTIYVFRGNDDATFDGFVSALNEAILAEKMPDESKAGEP